MLIYTYQPVNMEVSLAHQRQEEENDDNILDDNRNKHIDEDNLRNYNEGGDKEDGRTKLISCQLFLKASVTLAIVALLSIVGIIYLKNSSTTTSTPDRKSQIVQKEIEVPNPSFFLRQQPARDKKESFREATIESIVGPSTDETRISDDEDLPMYTSPKIKQAWNSYYTYDSNNINMNSSEYIPSESEIEDYQRHNPTYPKEWTALQIDDFLEKEESDRLVVEKEKNLLPIKNNIYDESGHNNIARISYRDEKLMYSPSLVDQIETDLALRKNSNATALSHKEEETLEAQNFHDQKQKARKKKILGQNGYPGNPSKHDLTMDSLPSTVSILFEQDKSRQFSTIHNFFDKQRSIVRKHMEGDPSYSLEDLNKRINALNEKELEEKRKVERSVERSHQQMLHDINNDYHDLSENIARDSSIYSDLLKSHSIKQDIPNQDGNFTSKNVDSHSISISKKEGVEEMARKQQIPYGVNKPFETSIPEELDASLDNLELQIRVQNRIQFFNDYLQKEKDDEEQKIDRMQNLSEGEKIRMKALISQRVEVQRNSIEQQIIREEEATIAYLSARIHDASDGNIVNQDSNLRENSGHNVNGDFMESLDHDENTNENDLDDTKKLKHSNLNYAKHHNLHNHVDFTTFSIQHHDELYQYILQPDDYKSINDARANKQASYKGYNLLPESGKKLITSFDNDAKQQRVRFEDRIDTRNGYRLRQMYIEGAPDEEIFGRAQQLLKKKQEKLHSFDLEIGKRRAKEIQELQIYIKRVCSVEEDKANLANDVLEGEYKRHLSVLMEQIENFETLQFESIESRYDSHEDAKNSLISAMLTKNNNVRDLLEAELLHEKSLNKDANFLEVKRHIENLCESV